MIDLTKCYICRKDIPKTNNAVWGQRLTVKGKVICEHAEALFCLKCHKAAQDAVDLLRKCYSE